MSRLSLRRSAAAAFGPAQRSGRGSLSTASVAAVNNGDRERDTTARRQLGRRLGLSGDTLSVAVRALGLASSRNFITPSGAPLAAA